MTTLLQINSSLFAGNGQSSQLSDKFVAAWKDSNPQGRVVTRDLSAQPVPHLDAERFGAFLAAPDARTPAQRAVVEFSDGLIEELRNADVIVLGLPMYNFGIPSTLKAYFDHVARAGVTFRYTANGPEGLLQNKKVYVMAARGGLYAGTPRDSQSVYVRDFLAFIGLTDVEFIYAEGLSMGEDSKRKALTDADAAIGQLAEPLRAAA